MGKVVDLTSQKLTVKQKEVMHGVLDTISKNSTLLSQNAVGEEMFKRVALNAVLENPNLLECEKSELEAVIRRAARDGLIPDGKHAVIYAKRNKQGGYSPVYYPMVTGLVNAATKAFPEMELRYDAVCENDSFKCVMGTEQVLEHVKHLTGTRGAVVGAYCCVRKTKNEGWMINLMTREDLEQVKTLTKVNGADSPWIKWEKQQSIKTAIKRSLRFLSSSNAQLEGIFESDNAGNNNAIDLPTAVHPIKDSPVMAQPVKKEAPKPLPKKKEVYPEAEVVKQTKPAPAPAPTQAPAQAQAQAPDDDHMPGDEPPYDFDMTDKSF